MKTLRKGQAFSVVIDRRAEDYLLQIQLGGARFQLSLDPAELAKLAEYIDGVLEKGEGVKA